MNYRKSAKQAWGIGTKVNVGFVRGLTVIGKILLPGGDAWLLEAQNGSKYEFVPHRGLLRV